MSLCVNLCLSVVVCVCFVLMCERSLFFVITENIFMPLQYWHAAQLPARRAAEQNRPDPLRHFAESFTSRARAQWHSFSSTVAGTLRVPSAIPFHSDGDGIWKMPATFQGDVHSARAARRAGSSLPVARPGQNMFQRIVAMFAFYV